MGLMVGVRAVQIPRFAFEKFPGSKAELSTQMKSVGEAMAIGRTFQVPIHLTGLLSAGERMHAWTCVSASLVTGECV